MYVALFDASCDFLAKTKLGPNPMSTSAHQFCPDCDVDQTSLDYGKPFSFLKGCACPMHAAANGSQNDGSHANGSQTDGTQAVAKPRTHLRSLSRTLTQLDYAFKIRGKKERKAYMRRKGLRVSMKSVYGSPWDPIPMLTLLRTLAEILRIASQVLPRL
jgi:hypothetical protein